LRDLQQKATRIYVRLQERKVERERETRYRPNSEANTFPRRTNGEINSVPQKTTAWNPPKPTFTPAPSPVPVAAPRPRPMTPARVLSTMDGTTPMELDSQREMLTTWEKEECMRRGLCFHCKDRGHISARCPSRTRIVEMEMERQLSENDGAQE